MMAHFFRTPEVESEDIDFLNGVFAEPNSQPPKTRTLVKVFVSRCEINGKTLRLFENASGLYEPKDFATNSTEQERGLNNSPLLIVKCKESCSRTTRCYRNGLLIQLITSPSKEGCMVSTNCELSQEPT